MADLLIDDVLQLVLSNRTLNIWDGHAACVCRAWRQAWEATRDQRRGLRDTAPLGEPHGDIDVLAVAPDGRTVCIAKENYSTADCDSLEFYDGNMQLLIPTQSLAPIRCVAPHPMCCGGRCAKS